ncbi:MAG: NAD-dependent epimerase/dehydratase family protein [Deltaproteobacteria bacterium]|nr:NAD-dependent epimerase/dehydratase family protein [Deltaproteobacteria bacterium]
MGVLVTGGTGFIGAQIVRFLLEKGEKDLVVFDINPSTKLLSGVEDRIEVVRGDLGNMSHVLNVVKGFSPKVIYHLGGMLSVPSDADPAASFRANAMGTFHILEAARLFEVPQVIFSSTLGTYGYDLDNHADVIDDYTLQRPVIFYGATKVFCEHMGLFYKRKYGLDFRGLRYPSIVGPGVKTPGVAQFTSWAIEESVKGNPFTIWVKPESKCAVMYFKDAALAAIKLGEAPLSSIKMVNYMIGGATPIASARELADIVKKKIPTAKIDFKPDPEIQMFFDKLLPIDDSIARKEWDWDPEYDQERIVDDFIEEMRLHHERYA